MNKKGLLSDVDVYVSAAIVHVAGRRWHVGNVTGCLTYVIRRIVQEGEGE